MIPDWRFVWSESCQRPCPKPAGLSRRRTACPKQTVLQKRVSCRCSNWPEKEARALDRARANGFTLLESLCALLCTLLLLFLAGSVLSGAKQLAVHEIQPIREIGILQLRQMAAAYDRIWIEEDILHLENASSSITLEYHNGRIVRRPGYEIFLESLEEGRFFQKEEAFYLEVQKGRRKFCWQIS